MQHMTGMSNSQLGSLKRTNKIDKPLARLIKKTDARQKVNNIRK